MENIGCQPDWCVWFFTGIKGPVGNRGERGEPGDPGYPVSIPKIWPQYQNRPSIKNILHIEYWISIWK